MPDSRDKRRWQFSLKALMIATFLSVPGAALAVLACAGRARMLQRHMGWAFLATFAPLPGNRHVNGTHLGAQLGPTWVRS